MNKADLITAVAEKTGMSKSNTEKNINAFMEAISDALQAGKKVQLMGFGTFEVKERAARKGHNPMTKQEIEIPASKAPVFKAGKQLKESVS